MKKLILVLPLAATLVGCNQKQSNVQILEQLDAQMKSVSQEYQRHLEREMKWAQMGVEMPVAVKDSFAIIDSTYQNKLKEISDKVDSISKIK
jgi:hypothetical protein